MLIWAGVGGEGMFSGKERKIWKELGISLHCNIRHDYEKVNERTYVNLKRNQY